MSRRSWMVVAITLAITAPATAQSWEASALVGFTPSVSLDQHAPELDGLDIRGGFTWGVQGARQLTPRWSAEAVWMQQDSALELGTAEGKSDLFEMTLRQLHGHVLYHFRSKSARLQPFVFGGVGATFFSADDLESETKLSLGLGGGIKYYFSKFGVRAHVRYNPTLLNDDDSDDFCDPFGFCQGTLQQIQFAVGGIIRF